MRRTHRIPAALLALLALVLVFGIAACAPADENPAPSDEDLPTVTDEPAEPELSPAEQKLAMMTLEQKVAQLFIVTPETLENPAAAAAQATGATDDPSQEVAPVTEVDDDIRQNLQKYPVGGVILFAQNIVDPSQTTKLTRDLQEAAQGVPGQIPLFICVDEEGGIVARLANNEKFGLPTYESAGAVGSSGNSEDAHEMGSTIGNYLKTYGFTVDFAPDADVNTNPDNPVIGTRAFSSDPQVAAEMADAFAEGLRENGVIATFKHFPGHGNTAQDSHTTLATTNATLDELTTCEFLPFEKATDEDWVMVGHIAAPQVTGDDTPASLSSTLVTDTLRAKLGFNGIVVTDALNMGAIVESYGAGECAVKALQAGCDVLLMPVDFEKASSAVLSAVQDGTLTEDRINESVLKILEAKYGADPAAASDSASS